MSDVVIDYICIQQYPEKHRKLVYCSRTVPEIDKALGELKRLMKYRRSQGLQEDFFGIGLTSRKNLCLNPIVSKERKGKSVDSKCRNLTASWVRSKVIKKKNAEEQQQTDDPMDVDQPVPLCDFYEVILHLDRKEHQKVDVLYDNSN